jgi:hypothetical protein
MWKHNSLHFKLSIREAGSEPYFQRRYAGSTALIHLFWVVTSLDSKGSWATFCVLAFIVKRTVIDNGWGHKQGFTVLTSFHPSGSYSFARPFFSPPDRPWHTSCQCHIHSSSQIFLPSNLNTWSDRHPQRNIIFYWPTRKAPITVPIIVLLFFHCWDLPSLVVIKTCQLVWVCRVRFPCAAFEEVFWIGHTTSALRVCSFQNMPRTSKP